MKQIVIFIIFMFLSATFCLAEDKIVIAVDNANAPFMYGDREIAQGVYPGIIEAIFKKMGKTIEVQPVPWKRALDMGEKGKSGIAGIYKNEARLKIFDYSEPLFEEKLNFYVRSGDIFDFKEISDLKNKNIGVIRGWSYGDAFDKGKQEQVFKVEENISDELNFKKLVAKRLHTLISIEESADTAVTKLGYKGKVDVLPKPFAVNPTYLVFAKNTNQLPLIEEFNNTIKAMKQDGSYITLIKSLFEKEATK